MSPDRDLYDVMRCAPSTRRFSDRAVPRDAIERVLEAARSAPSGGNRQGWRVIVITEPDTHIAVGSRADAWPRALSREPTTSFAFAERYGEPWQHRKAMGHPLPPNGPKGSAALVEA